MYPLSPRNSFVGNQKEGESLLSDIIPSSIYPSSSNDSCCKLKIDLNRSNSYTENNDGTVLNCRNSLDLMRNSVFEECRHPRNRIASKLCKQNTINNPLTEDYLLVGEQFQDKNKLIEIINKQRNEFNVLKLQYNELRKKELDFERNYELLTAKQSDMKITIANLENTISGLKKNKYHQINTLSKQLQNSKKSELCNKIDSLASICNDIFKSKASSHNCPELTQKLSELMCPNITSELCNELQTIIEERDELLKLVNSLSSTPIICDSSEINNENLRQLSLFLFEQIQTLSFKLRRSNKVREKIITKITNSIEALEERGETSNIAKELKEQLHKINISI